VEKLVSPLSSFSSAMPWRCATPELSEDLAAMNLRYGDVEVIHARKWRDIVQLIWPTTRNSILTYFSCLTRRSVGKWCYRKTLRCTPDECSSYTVTDRKYAQNSYSI